MIRLMGVCGIAVVMMISWFALAPHGARANQLIIITAAIPQSPNNLIMT